MILLGEMRDKETMEVAMTAAETGQLLLSSLHTTGAANTIDRIIDAFPPNQQAQIRFYSFPWFCRRSSVSSSCPA